MKSLRQLEYGRILRNPRWQKMRLQIMERDNWACLFCGNKDDTLNVHHEYYKPYLKPWEYEPESLLTLCEPCHIFIHKIPIDLSEYKHSLTLLHGAGALTDYALNYLHFKYELRGL